MKTIKIRDYSTKSELYFICPFCKEKTVVDGNPQRGCEHVIYSYDTFDNKPLGEYKEIINVARLILAHKPFNFLNSFVEFWYDNYG